MKRFEIFAGDSYALISRENRRLSQYSDRSGDNYTLFEETDRFVCCSPDINA